MDFLKAVARGVVLILVVYCDLIGAAFGFLAARRLRTRSLQPPGD